MLQYEKMCTYHEQHFIKIFNQNSLMNRYFLYLISCLLTFSCKKPTTADTILKNVNVVNVETGAIILNQDIAISGTTITSILPHGKSDVEAKTVIEGKDQYLIPGLWDMHEHMMREKWYASQMPLLRAKGITGFREMWGDLKIVNHVKSQMERDSLPYFRFVASGHILDGAKPFWNGSIPIDSEKRVIKVIDSLINEKADFIKVYSFLTPDLFQAIANRCKEKGISFSGHVPHCVWLTDASSAGISSMEHLYGFLIEACSNSDSAMALMRQSVDAFEKGKTEERRQINRLYHSLVLEHFSEERLRSMAKTLRKNNTHIVPTLVTLRSEYFTNDTSFTNDPRLKYMSKETLDYWKETTENDIQENTEVDWQNKRKRWQIEQKIMRILISEKVPIMAGTDADNPYAFPGFSLHDELALYVECGMTPLEALRSATIIPAEFLKMTDSLGTIEKGKLADLVLLEANPLENIKNTSKVSLVIANGKIYGGDYINSVLKR
jgi:hypothetical protein